MIETERITQIFGLPMMYRQMLEHPDIQRRDLSILRRALYAMAPMAEAQLRRCLDGHSAATSTFSWGKLR